MRRLSRWFVLAGAALFGAVLSGVAVPPPGAAAAPGAATLAPIMLVVDASGSMTDADPSGGTRMAAARSAVHALVRQLPTRRSG